MASRAQRDDEQVIAERHEEERGIENPEDEQAEAAQLEQS